METQPPVFTDVVDAARRLRGRAVVTPLLRCDALDRQVGGRLLIKAEALQRTGSFKFRGAFNRIDRLDAVARARGVVAWSSGNHAQGVAAAAGLLGAPVRSSTRRSLGGSLGSLRWWRYICVFSSTRWT